MSLFDNLPNPNEKWLSQYLSSGYWSVQQRNWKQINWTNDTRNDKVAEDNKKRHSCKISRIFPKPGISKVFEVALSVLISHHSLDKSKRGYVKNECADQMALFNLFTF